MPWLTPDEIPEGDTCRPLFIPDNSDWLAIVSGAILELTREWNWEQFGAVTPAEAAARMQELMQQYYDDSCGEGDCPPLLRVDETGLVQELVDGVWTEPTGALTLPPTTARSEPTLDERRCLAAANAAKVLELLYEDVTDSFNADLDLNDAAANFAAAVAALVLVPVYGLVAAGLIALGRIIWSVVYDTLQFIQSDVWTTDFNDKVKCLLYDAAEDGGGGVIHFNYDAFMDSLARSTEITLDLYQLRLFGQISYIMWFLGSQALDEMGATTSVTSSVCDCSVCTVTYNDTMNFGLGSRTSMLPYATGDTPAAWQPTGGRNSPGCVWANFKTGAGYYIYGQVDLGQDCYLQEFSFWWKKTNASQFCSLRVTVLNEAGTLVYNELVHNGVIASNTWNQYYRIIGLATGRYARIALFTTVAGGQLYLDEITAVTS